MDLHDREWGRKGATLSDKTARQEYGLTQDEIFAAIDAGKLQYRPAAMHGNPWLRLLRSERSEEHTSELQSPYDHVCQLLLEKKKKKIAHYNDLKKKKIKKHIKNKCIDR